MTDPKQTTSGLNLLLASLFLLLSGAAALIYQVAWVRLLGMSVGASHEAVATVLAAFFFGMAAGSLLAARWTRRGGDIRLYVVLELVLGASAMGVFWVLLHLDQVLGFAPAFGSSSILRFALVFAVLSIPTICMGATFPVMVAICVRANARVGDRIGLLYAINTAGAVAGALVGGFVLLPRFGLGGAVHTGVALNLLVAAIASLVPRKEPEELAPALSKPKETDLRLRALAVLACTGFVAIAVEVGWTRALAIFTGSTVYGFSAILAAFLIGIALGSWAIGRRLERFGQPVRVLAFGLVALGAALVATRVGLSTIPELQAWAEGLELTHTKQNWVKYGAIFALLLPSTLLFGALFPVSLRFYCGDSDAVGPAVGRAYAVNTVAGIFGSLAAGFWLLPLLGTDGLLVCLALVPLATAIALTGFPFDRALATRLAPAALLLGAAVFFLPGVDVAALTETVRYRQDVSEEERAREQTLYLEEGRTGVISVVTRDGVWADLANNGLKEATLDLQDPRSGPMVEGLLGLFPYFLHPDPKDAFVVGFGGGTTVQALTLTDLSAIRVVELEPKVVDAVRSVHGGRVPCLDDPRVELTFNDARNTLLVEKTKYDLIASQPSHPWIAGAGNLFSHEFFSIVRSRLNPGGVYCQWLNLFRMDPVTLQSIVQTFYDVFPHGFVCINAPTEDLFLIGSVEPPMLVHQRVEDRLADSPELDKYMTARGFEFPGNLLQLFFTSRRQAVVMAGDAPMNTDRNLLSEMRLASLGRDSSSAQASAELLRDFYSLDLLQFLPPEDQAAFLLELGRAFLRDGLTQNAGVVREILIGIGAPGTANKLSYEAADIMIQGNKVED